MEKEDTKKDHKKHSHEAPQKGRAMDRKDGTGRCVWHDLCWIGLGGLGCLSFVQTTRQLNHTATHHPRSGQVQQKKGGGGAHNWGNELDVDMNEIMDDVHKELAEGSK